MIWRPRYMVGKSRAIACSCFSMSFSVAKRKIFLTLSSSLMFFFNNWSRTSSPWRETTPSWVPLLESTITESPVWSSSWSALRKYSFLPPLNFTSTMWKRWKEGTSKSDNQSKTFILLQPPEPQPPLLWQPFTSPLALVEPHDPLEHDLHAIS